eukprot:TRINITY_DN17436_c0_g1_i1.p2 TRINITY_DN17436_c0_g1~~TRINITY_DN17436_c0_g1_i1.p2  ORF type:complete len:179 (+),score=61.34 TRINITY_DN17436_c0_g1_i1:63-599(+)
MPQTPRGARPRLLHEGTLWEYHGDVVEKLTDESLFTGIHKRRYGTAAPGDADALDKDGSRWSKGLRSGLYKSDGGAAPARPRPRKAPLKTPVPRYAAHPGYIRTLQDDLERLLHIEGRLRLPPTPTCWPDGAPGELEAEVEMRWARIQRVAPDGVPPPPPQACDVSPPRHRVELKFHR